MVGITKFAGIFDTLEDALEGLGWLSILGWLCWLG
jgi:hypothetical protein